MYIQVHLEIMKRIIMMMIKSGRKIIYDSNYN